MLKNKFPILRKNPAQKYQKFLKGVLQILILGIFFVMNLSGQENFEAAREMNWELPFKKCWTIPSKGELIEKPASDNVTNITFSNFNLLKSINPLSGSEIWKTDLGGILKFKPVSDGKDIFLIIQNGNNSSIIRSISETTGLTNWQIDLGNTGKTAGYLNSQYFFVFNDKGFAAGLDKNSGKLLWSKVFESSISSFISTNRLKGSENILLFTDRKIVGLSPRDGVLQNEWEFPSRKALRTIIWAEDKIFYGDSSGGLFCFDLIGKKTIWQAKTGGSVSSLTEVYGKILVTSFDNFVYFFSAKNGNLIWKKRLAGRINFKPLIYLNYAIIVNTGDTTALIIDLESGKSINQISIEENDFFSGMPRVWKNLLIFQTFRNIIGFSNLGCQKNKDEAKI